MSLCFLTGCHSSSEKVQVSSGRAVIHEGFNSQFIPPKNFTVWLPEGYEADQRYPVLYLHDSQMLFDAAHTWNHQEWGVDETLSQLIVSEKVEAPIVVGIWNAGPNRHSEYFPQKPFESLLPNQQDSLYQLQRPDGRPMFGCSVYSDAYLQFLVTELKPFIDEHYATLTDRSNIYIGGSSMGGLISWYALCEYPEVFGGAACLSTHWPGVFAAGGNPVPPAFLYYFQQQLPSPEEHRFYFDLGTETLDTLYPAFQHQADQILQQRGYGPSQCNSQTYQGAAHDERSWRERFDQPMLFLLGKSRD